MAGMEELNDDFRRLASPAEAAPSPSSSRPHLIVLAYGSPARRVIVPRPATLPDGIRSARGLFAGLATILNTAAGAREQEAYFTSDYLGVEAEITEGAWESMMELVAGSELPLPVLSVKTRPASVVFPPRRTARRNNNGGNNSVLPPPPALAPARPGQVQFYVTDSTTQDTLTFRISLATPLRALFSKYESRMRAPRGSLSFWFQGAEVKAQDTAGSLGIEEGETLIAKKRGEIEVVDSDEDSDESEQE